MIEIGGGFHWRNRSSFSAVLKNDENQWRFPLVDRSEQFQCSWVGWHFPLAESEQLEEEEEEENRFIT